MLFRQDYLETLAYEALVADLLDNGCMPYFKRVNFFLFITLVFGGIGELFAQNKHSSALCSTIYRSANYGCSDSASANSPGASFPLLFDAFNLSPSNLPTYTAPLGLEVYSSGDALNFSLIKGLEGWGSGLNIKNSDVTYFSNFENHKLNLKALDSYNDQILSPYTLIGGAIDTFNIPDFISLPIGLGIKLSDDSMSWVPGITVKGKFFSLAASYYKEDPEYRSDGYYQIDEKRKYLSLVAGLRVWNFMFDYSYHNLDYEASYKVITSGYTGDSGTTYLADYNVNTHIFSTTFGSNNFQLTYAYRYQETVELKEWERVLLNRAPDPEIKKKHQLYGVRWQPFKIFAAGIYYNYALDDAWRLVAQIYF